MKLTKIEHFVSIQHFKLECNYLLYFRRLNRCADFNKILHVYALITEIRHKLLFNVLTDIHAGKI